MTISMTCGVGGTGVSVVANLHLGGQTDPACADLVLRAEVIVFARIGVIGMLAAEEDMARVGRAVIAVIT